MKNIISVWWFSKYLCPKILFLLLSTWRQNQSLLFASQPCRQPANKAKMMFLAVNNLTFNWVGECCPLQVTLLFVSVIWHLVCFASYFSPLRASQYNWIISHINKKSVLFVYIWSQLELLKVHKNSFNFWTKLIKVFLFLPRNKKSFSKNTSFSMHLLSNYS